MANRYSPDANDYWNQSGQQAGGAFQSPADQGQGGSWFDQQPAPPTGGGMNTGPMHTMTTPGQTGQPGMPGVYGQIQGGLTPGGGGPQGTDYESWFRSLVGNRPWNQQSFNELAPTLKQYGFNITPPNAVGDQTKIQLPTGEWVRVGFGEGHPVWIPQNNAGATGTNFGSAGPNPSGTGINSPWAIPPPFKSPSLEEFQQEPGLQARLAMGQQALERGAASKGSLLSGGFQQQLNRYAQNFGSNEYNNSYQRAYQNYAQNYNIQSAAPWQRFNDIANRGLAAAQSTKTSVPIGG